jgi:hypothetical protein
MPRKVRRLLEDPDMERLLSIASEIVITSDEQFRKYKGVSIIW